MTLPHARQRNICGRRRSSVASAVYLGFEKLRARPSRCLAGFETDPREAWGLVRDRLVETRVLRRLDGSIFVHLFDSIGGVL